MTRLKLAEVHSLAEHASAAGNCESFAPNRSDRCGRNYPARAAAVAPSPSLEALRRTETERAQVEAAQRAQRDALSKPE